MPVMNGWDFLDEFIRKGFNKLFPDTRIIVLSSSIDPRDIQRASNYDIIIEFISKPLTLKVIKEIKQHSALVPHFS
jgi:CheY-like chemotaxis protein